MKRGRISLLFALLAALVVTSVVSAGSSSLWPGSVNNKTVYGQKGISATSTTWSGWLLSKTSGTSVLISEIGWTFYNLQEFCGSTGVSQIPYGGGLDYNDWYKQGSGSSNIATNCTGHSLVITGRHQYTDGGQTTNIDNSYSETH